MTMNRHAALTGWIRPARWTAGLLLAGCLAVPVAAQPAETPSPPAGRGRPDYPSFRIITERNIFNAGRSGRASAAPAQETRRPPARVDTLALVGVMDYARGPHAFFDGSSPEFRKVLKPGESLAGLKLVEVLPNGVQLEAGTNRLELRVGAQLRREEQGPWQVSERAEPLAGAASPASSGGAAPGNGGSADADEVLKRLLQRREQETR